MGRLKVGAKKQSAKQLQRKVAELSARAPAPFVVLDANPLLLSVAQRFQLKLAQIDTLGGEDPDARTQAKTAALAAAAAVAQEFDLLGIPSQSVDVYYEMIADYNGGPKTYFWMAAAHLVIAVEAVLLHNRRLVSDATLIKAQDDVIQIITQHKGDLKIEDVLPNHSDSTEQRDTHRERLNNYRRKFLGTSKAPPPYASLVYSSLKEALSDVPADKLPDLANELVRRSIRMLRISKLARAAKSAKG